MPKKRRVPESPLKSVNWPFSLEQDLATFLVILERRFQSDRSNPLPAFEVLAYLAAYAWQKGDSPPRTLPVPWWVIQALAIGFRNYRDSAGSTTPMTLGEAYNLEGRGQGKRPRIQRELRELRNIRIALAIALEEAAGVKLEASLHAQADKAGLSLGQIRRIWESRCDQARTLVCKPKDRA